MNIFRLLGDFSHLAAIIILLLKIWTTRSCAGKFLLLLSIIVTICFFFFSSHLFKVYRVKVFFFMQSSLHVDIWIYFFIL